MKNTLPRLSASKPKHPAPAPALPATGFLREWDLLGRPGITEEEAAHNRKAGKGGRTPRPAIAAILPISHSTWWKGISEGRYPAPVRMGRCTMWRVSDIRRLIDDEGAPQP